MAARRKRNWMYGNYCSLFSCWNWTVGSFGHRLWRRARLQEGGCSELALREGEGDSIPSVFIRKFLSCKRETYLVRIWMIQENWIINGKNKKVSLLHCRDCIIVAFLDSHWLSWRSMGTNTFWKFRARDPCSQGSEHWSDLKRRAEFFTQRGKDGCSGIYLFIPGL